jgi:hypothetical protein
MSTTAHTFPVVLWFGERYIVTPWVIRRNEFIYEDASTLVAERVQCEYAVVLPESQADDVSSLTGVDLRQRFAAWLQTTALAVPDQVKSVSSRVIEFGDVVVTADFNDGGKTRTFITTDSLTSLDPTPTAFFAVRDVLANGPVFSI